MDLSPISVAIHPNRFPEAMDAQVAASLAEARLPTGLHYLSRRQARAWLVLHRRCAPYCNAADGIALYERAAAGAVAHLPMGPLDVISLGCGGGQKDRLLLELLASRQVRYVPVDAGLDLLLQASDLARKVLGPAQVQPQLFDLDAEDDWADALAPVLNPAALRVVLCFGLLPGMNPARAGLRLRAMLRSGDRVLFSANLAPGPDAMHGAQAALAGYDNAETRAWLGLALEELGLDPGAGAWRFEVVRDGALPGLPRIEGWFMPERGAVVQCGRHTIEVRPAIPLRVLISNRFTVESVETLARVHGLVLLDRQISQAGDEGVFLAALAAPGQGRGKKILRDLAC